jgi:FdhD protein
MNKVETYKIVKYDETLIEQTDVIIIEFPLTVFVNDKELATLLCTPEDMDLLVLGYLRSEHLIETKADIDGLVIDDDKGLAYVTLHKDVDLDEFRNRYITSGCASSAVYYKTLDAVTLRFNSINTHTVKMSNVFECMKSLNQNSSLFKDTGGVHIAGLYEEERLIVTKEDIGRHNAVDKIIGYLLEHDMTAENKTLYLSGRVSSEMILKCAKAGISAVVSRSAPMSVAIKLAQMHDILLMGFVRGHKGNIYNGKERVEV